MPPGSPSPRRIGLFANTLGYTYQNDILLGAHQELSARGADLYCFSGGPLLPASQLAHERSSIYDLIGPQDLDGLILTTSTLAHEVGQAEVMAFCRRFHPIPICSIGYEVEGVCSLLVDNTSGVHRLTAHLIEAHGRRRIAFVSGPSRNRESGQRRAGYEAALVVAGIALDPDLVIPGDYTREAGLAAVRRLFDEGAGCDAVVAANDWMALGVLEALDQRGIRTPSDVAVIGFDDIDEARFTTPPLTTIRQPIRDLGGEAARMVLALADSQPVPPIVTLPTSVRVRQSCGCFQESPTLRAPLDPAGAAGVESLARNRGALAEIARDAAPEGDPGVVGDWPGRLVDALCRDLTEGAEQGFLDALGELLHHAASLGNIHAWHSMLAALRASCVTQLAGAPLDWLRAENIFERAHVLVSDVAERAQGRRRTEQEGLLRVLQESSAALRTAFDMPSITRALTEHLPRVGVPSCFVALPQSTRLSSEIESRLAMAYDAERGALVTEGPDGAAPFRSGELIPRALAPQRRASMIVEPLFFGGDLLGYCVLEMGPREAAVYETLREQISAALKGARLFQTVVDEVTRREQAERARLEGEMQIATRIQTSILPKPNHESSRVEKLEIATIMLPATEVGGDYFDILPFEGGCWLGIGDVAGHGLPTGLVMLMIQSIVAATTRCRTDAPPAFVWQMVNSVLYDNVRQRLEQDEHATLTLIRYQSDGRLMFAGAHEPLVIFREQTGLSEIVPTPGMWAGATRRPRRTIEEGTATLAPGDVLVLYTDGITEALDPSGQQFELGRLAAEVERVGHRPVDEVRDHVIAAVRAWSAAQNDDQTLVVLRYTGS